MTSRLDALDRLVGTWDWVATDDGTPMVRGTAAFEWIDGRFLIHRADAVQDGTTPQLWIDNWPYPHTTVYAVDDRTGAFTAAYADARDVHRVYEMSLEGNEWKTWGQAGPEFFQRFIGTIGDEEIAGRYERSADGQTWETDFDITYTRR